MLKRKLPRKQGIKRKKEKSISQLIKEADKLFSLRVRGKNVDEDGFCTCFTCGFKGLFKRVHCGHYVSRFYKAVRWNEDNARVQCWVCNIYKKGDAAVFRIKLVKEIGEKRVRAVEDGTKTTRKLTRTYLEELIKTLQ